MSEKLNGATVKISLAGENAKAYLSDKNVLEKSYLDENGNYVVGRFSGRQRRAALGTTSVDFGLIKETNNREVILFGGWLGNGKRGRRISVSNEEGLGIQQFRNGVDVIVQTDAPTAVFERSVR